MLEQVLDKIVWDTLNAAIAWAKHYAFIQSGNERGSNLKYKKATSHLRRLVICNHVILFGCGGRIWTYDLQVMSMTPAPQLSEYIEKSTVLSNHYSRSNSFI